MRIDFATCERNRALSYIQKVYPSKEITDTTESAGPLLDMVEEDLVRIQDPMMYGNQIQVIPGKKWTESDELRDKVITACKIFTERD
jgi:hypothetical protein